MHVFTHFHILSLMIRCPMFGPVSTDNQAAASADQGSFPGLLEWRHANCGWWGFHQRCAELLWGNIAMAAQSVTMILLFIDFFSVLLRNVLCTLFIFYFCSLKKMLLNIHQPLIYIAFYDIYISFVVICVYSVFRITFTEDLKPVFSLSRKALHSLAM